MTTLRRFEFRPNAFTNNVPLQAFLRRNKEFQWAQFDRVLTNPPGTNWQYWIDEGAPLLEYILRRSARILARFARNVARRARAARQQMALNLALGFRSGYGTPQ